MNMFLGPETTINIKQYKIATQILKEPLKISDTKPVTITGFFYSRLKLLVDSAESELDFLSSWLPIAENIDQRITKQGFHTGSGLEKKTDMNETQESSNTSKLLDTKNLSPTVLSKKRDSDIIKMAKDIDSEQKTLDKIFAEACLAYTHVPHVESTYLLLKQLNMSKKVFCSHAPRLAHEIAEKIFAQPTKALQEEINSCINNCISLPTLIGLLRILEFYLYTKHTISQHLPIIKSLLETTISLTHNRFAVVLSSEMKELRECSNIGNRIYPLVEVIGGLHELLTPIDPINSELTAIDHIVVGALKELHSSWKCYVFEKYKNLTELKRQISMINEYSTLIYLLVINDSQYEAHGPYATVLLDYVKQLVHKLLPKLFPFIIFENKPQLKTGFGSVTHDEILEKINQTKSLLNTEITYDFALKGIYSLLSNYIQTNLSDVIEEACQGSDILILAAHFSVPSEYTHQIISEIEM